MSEDTREPVGGSKPSPGPFLAKIVSFADPTYMGMLQVQLLHEVGNNEASETELHLVKYMSPFAGQTNVDYLGKEPDDYDNTQKSYGMWMIPPDVGSTVVVIFIDGDPKKGFWIGCVPDTYMNFSVPGHAATQFSVEDSKSTDKERVPVGEYNREANPTTADPTQIAKPASPLEKVFDGQGLLEDDTRGITTSSARREIPSAVFGISTPGPIDKTGKRGTFGKSESRVASGFVSRLPGSTFVMDDGDDKFLRRTEPSEGPPDYAAVEQNETDGLPNHPHNELVRIRTRTGHQILLHNSEDLIYIGNARGTAWIELTSDGKMDIFCQDSINIRTKADFNFYADRDINFEAKRNINIKAGEECQLETGLDYNVIVGKDGKLTISGNYDINSGGYIYQTSGGANHTKAGGQIVETGSQIHMNGPAASTATKAKFLKKHNLVDLSTQDADLGELLSILRRVPTPEPYPQHENLDPAKVKTDIIDRDAEGRYQGDTSTMAFAAEYWKKYTTKTDTFAKIKAGGEDQQTEE